MCSLSIFLDANDNFEVPFDKKTVNIYLQIQMLDIHIFPIFRLKAVVIVADKPLF